MRFAKAIKLAAKTAAIGSTRTGEPNPERGWRPVVKGNRVAAIQKPDV